MAAAARFEHAENATVARSGRAKLDCVSDFTSTMTFLFDKRGCTMNKFSTLVGMILLFLFAGSLTAGEKAICVVSPTDGNKCKGTVRFETTELLA